MHRLVAVALVALAAVSCSGEPQPDTGPAESAFAEYQAALLARDGDTAVAVVTPETFDYYARGVAAALEADLDDLMAMPLSGALNAVVLRAAFSPEDLRSMDGAEAFRVSVARGMVDDAAVSRGLEQYRWQGDAVFGVHLPFTISLIDAPEESQVLEAMSGVEGITRAEVLAGIGRAYGLDDVFTPPGR